MLTSRKQQLMLIVALIVVGAMVYGFNLHNGLFWDDTDWIVNNPFVHGVTWENIKFWFSHNTLAGIGLTSNYYRPFLFFTFAVNYAISGTNPVSYHLVSNALHILNTILIFLLFSQVLKSRRIGFITALLFLVHPIATEAVTYIAGRGDPLYVFFTLVGLWLFYTAETHNLSWRSWQKMASLIVLVLGLLSREVAIIFPALALVFSMAFLEARPFAQSLRNAFKKTWPYFLVVLMYGILRLTVLNFDNTLNFYAIPNIYSEYLYVRMFTFMHVLFDYVKILLIPINLHMERSVPIHLSPFNWPVWLMVVLLVSGGYGLFRLYRRTRENSVFRLWFFAAGWFFIGLGPVSGITPINAQIYEHWLYLPSIAVFLLFAYYFNRLVEILSHKRKTLVSIFIGLFTLYACWLSYQSIQRNIIWGKPIEFYQDILRYEPDSVRINNNLGNKYYDQGDTEKAEHYYRRATEIEDIFPQPHYNLGTILQAKGDLRGAIVEYEKAIEINPYFHYPYQNLAAIYAQQGDLVKARDILLELEKIRPNNPVMYFSLAAILQAQGNYAQAKAYAEKGLFYAQPDSKVYQELKNILTQLEKQL